MSGIKSRGLRIGEMGEFAFIRSIQEGSHFSPEGLIKGIGDDCAVIGPYQDRVFLITTDLLVEDIHFIWDRISPVDLGQKAVAVNLSDIAAMGGIPRHLFLSLAIPPAMGVETLHSFYQGIKAMCERYDTNVLGGDTSASPDGLTINVTAIGEARGDEVLFRSGAKAGDKIYLTGTLGDSAAGLRLIKEEFSAPAPLAAVLKEAHNRPQPQVEAGRVIAQSGLATAMIDVSDGVLSDLGHVCGASGVGGILFESALPISNSLKALAEINNFNPYELALSGGEDYQLLFTVPREDAGQFETIFQENSSSPIYCLGEITGEEGIKIVRPGGVREEVKVEGFDHFSGR
ncbi:MAG: thiamine-phosphate kinase [Deltaproteobacteria bacterium]|nr:thiamine-phosphate kinase [Deltaproteobacteria bacterium]